MLSADQQAQAESLHNAVGWVYPSTEDAGFWDQFFSQSVPELTPQEQASGISLGPYGPGQQQAAYEREQAGLAQPLAPQGPLPAPGGAPQGLGGGLYNSSLIQALRAATPTGPSNPGVTMMPNAAPAAGGGLASTLPTGGLINNPPVLKLDALPAQGAYSQADVRDLLSQAYEDWAAQNLPQQPVYDPATGVTGGGN